MAAVAVVVEVAGIAGGAALAHEVAQPVVGGVAALPAEHPGTRRRGGPKRATSQPRAGSQTVLVPSTRAVPERSGAGTGGGDAATARPASRGSPGDRGEERVLEEPRQLGEAAGGGGLERGDGGLGLARQHVERRAVRRQQPDGRMRRGERLDERGGGREIAGLDRRRHPLQRAHDLRHREEVVGLRRLGPRGEALGPRRRRRRERAQGRRIRRGLGRRRPERAEGAEDQCQAVPIRHQVRRHASLGGGP